MLHILYIIVHIIAYTIYNAFNIVIPKFSYHSHFPVFLPPSQIFSKITCLLQCHWKFGNEVPESPEL